MSFRARLLAGFEAVALIPLVLFGLRVRATMVERLTAAYQQRVAALTAVISTDLERQSAGIAGRLDALKGAIAADNRFRNEYDRSEPELPRLPAEVGGTALVEARAPEGRARRLERRDRGLQASDRAGRTRRAVHERSDSSLLESGTLRGGTRAVGTSD